MANEENYHSIVQEFIEGVKQRNFSFSKAQFYSFDVTRLMESVSSFISKEAGSESVLMKPECKDQGELFGGCISLPSKLVFRIYGSEQANSGLQILESVLRACAIAAQESSRANHKKIIHFALYNGVNHFTHLRISLNKNAENFDVSIDNLDPIALGLNKPLDLSCIKTVVTKVFGDDAKIAEPQTVGLGTQHDGNMCAVYTLLSIARAARDADLEIPFGFTTQDVNEAVSPKRAKQLAYNLVKRLLQNELNELIENQKKAEASEQAFSTLLEANKVELGIDNPPLSENYQFFSCEELLTIETLSSKLREELAHFDKFITLDSLRRSNIESKKASEEMQTFLDALPDNFVDPQEDKIKKEPVHEYDNSEYVDPDAFLNEPGPITMKMLLAALQEEAEDYAQWLVDYEQRDEASTNDPAYMLQMLMDDEKRNRLTNSENESAAREKLQNILAEEKRKAEIKTAQRLKPITDFQTSEHHERSEIIGLETENRRSISAFFHQEMPPSLTVNQKTEKGVESHQDERPISRFFEVKRFANTQLIQDDEEVGDDQDYFEVKVRISEERAKELIAEMTDKRRGPIRAQP